MAIRFDAEQTVFEREGVVAAVAVLALGKVISDAILATELMDAEVGNFCAEFFHFREYRFTLRPALQVERLQAPFILFLRQLLIEDAVLLLVETDTPKAVTTTEAVFAELAVAAVGTVLAVVRHVTVGTVDALGAPLTSDAERESAAAHAFPRVPSVVHVLGVKDPETVVAIFGSHRLGVLAIFYTRLDKVVARLGQKEPLKFPDEVHRMRKRIGRFDAAHSVRVTPFFVKDVTTFQDSSFRRESVFALS